MPLSLLIALLIAFGFDAPWAEASGLSVPIRMLATVSGVLLIAALSFALGGAVVFRVGHYGYATSRVWRFYQLGSRVLTFSCLGIYAWIVHVVGWSKLVLATWGLRDLFLVDDLAILFPYAMMQLLVWTGLYFSERALHDSRLYPRLPVYLLLKSRQSVGLILPVVLIFIIRQDVFARFWPQWHRTSLAEPLELAALACLILLVSPLFVRLAWPTRSLPDGPLRRRLERAAERVGFRFTDLLVWDTRQIMVNACVTGVLPWFRYVLLTDALIESLSPAEVAAVFGHEVGHVAHRHLPFFGFFFLGSLGVMSLAAQAFSASEAWIEGIPWVSAGQLSRWSELSESIAILGCLGLFFWLVFGRLSRRFERQADVFGCKVVSCGALECPPHFDLEDGALTLAAEPPGAQLPAPGLCPVGIQIFIDALASVARQNGIAVAARSWRHGSIASRLAFLQQLQTNPVGEPQFQRGVRSFRFILSAFLLLTLALAVMTRSWELLH
jgi:STE24 endopeptidase